MADRPDSDIELHQLQLRFAMARVSDERAVRRLMQSIDVCGQLVACIAVREGAGEAARQCGRDASWVQRWLLLLHTLPEGVLDAVREASVSSWAAVRVFAPLARANADHARRLPAGMRGQALSKRDLQLWFAHYQRAQRREREPGGPDMYLQHFGLRHAPLGKELTEPWDDGALAHLTQRFNWLLQSPAWA
jgi:hypothetical protein